VHWSCCHAWDVSASDEPWRAPVRYLVLYNSSGEWRYAIYSDAGTLDGVLVGVPPNVGPEVAQAVLLDQVAKLTGRHYSANWQQDESHWWTAQPVVTTR
jgi:hypothetical protein